MRIQSCVTKISLRIDVYESKNALDFYLLNFAQVKQVDLDGDEMTFSRVGRRKVTSDGAV